MPVRSGVATPHGGKPSVLTFIRRASLAVRLMFDPGRGEHWSFS